jgi:pyruvate kinase
MFLAGLLWKKIEGTLLFMRLTKIIATVGPASQTPEVLETFIQLGVNVFRFNFSHGDHDGKGQVMQQVRQLSQKLNTHVAILADLQGPKIRVGKLKNGDSVPLDVGQTIRFKYSLEPGDLHCITTDVDCLVQSLSEDQVVLLDDGGMELVVLERLQDDEVLCKVVRGGLLKEKKGISVPGIHLNIPALTDKDKEDCKFALTQGVDFVAMSFVQSHQDVEALREFIRQHLPAEQEMPHIVAKIERPQALEDLDAIIQASDAIMVARGDLGVELQPQKVPSVQKMLIQKSNEYEKPVITATQMLETMIHESMPTRAEASDIANAIFDGTDAVMLSAETASGKFPVEAVEMMGKIIEEAEKHLPPWHKPDFRETLNWHSAFSLMMPPNQAIAHSAVRISQHCKVDAIVVFSMSGNMARRVSKRKPDLFVMALTPSAQVCRRLVLLWGVYPLQIQLTENSDETLLLAEKLIQEKGYLKQNDEVVFCAGKTHLPGMTNTLKVYFLGQAISGATARSQDVSLPIV